MYDINRSKISQSGLEAFLSAEVDEDLLSVPGIGPATVKKLAEHNIETTYQLISCFLRVCGKEMSSATKVNAFWFYLDKLGVPGGTRSTIVHAISEKVNIMIPGVFDPEKLECIDEADDYEDAEEGIAELTSEADERYLKNLLEAYDDELPKFEVYDASSIEIINILIREDCAPGFTRDDKGLVFSEGVLLVSPGCLEIFNSENDNVTEYYEIKSLVR